MVGHRQMIELEGGTFLMGSDRHYPEEGPAHEVAVGPFSIDVGPVTNAQFTEFVEATGYTTVAERPIDPALYPGVPEDALAPGAAVFTMTGGPVPLNDWSRWWDWVPGAYWRAPEGPGSDLVDREEHPVVHVCLEDVLAYCGWVGLDLPSEAEWEYAARGGLDGAEFSWGDEDTQDTAPRANTWQGAFPYENSELDGWTRTSPVGAYPSNGYGLHDMIGNVWEWTNDWYQARHAEDGPSCCVPLNPRGGSERDSIDPQQPQVPLPRKALKGGSHLCTTQYCFRYRPAARQAQTIDTALSNLGFRCVRRLSAPTGSP
jgi:formylglycine-generating enzyme required for sulfatase activity